VRVQDAGSNKGSAVIEMTILMPIFLGCVFMYILFFLFFIGNSKGMDETVEQLYRVDVTQISNLDKGVNKQGEMLSASYHNNDKWFDVNIQINRNGRNVLKSIRRWQLAKGKI